MFPSLYDTIAKLKQVQTMKENTPFYGQAKKWNPTEQESDKIKE